MSNIAIMGGTGFIGINFIKKIENQFDHILCIGQNFEKFKNCQFPGNVQFMSTSSPKEEFISEFKKNNISYFLDFAYSTVPKTSFEDPLNDISSNLYTTVNTFEWLKEVELKKVIWLSTGGALYGHSQEKLITETHPQNPISPYGITKLSIEKFAYMYYKLFNLPIVCLRPSNAFGPYQLPFRGQGFVSTAIVSLLQEKSIFIFGKNGTIRDYIFIDDLCEAILVALKHAPAGEVFNIGTGVGINNLEIINKLSELGSGINKSLKYEVLEKRSFDVNYNVLDSTKFTNSTGWVPKMNFNEGIVKTWEWYIKNYS